MLTLICSTHIHDIDDAMEHSEWEWGASVEKLKVRFRHDIYISHKVCHFHI